MNEKALELVKTLEDTANDLSEMVHSGDEFVAATDVVIASVGLQKQIHKARVVNECNDV